MLQVGPDSTGIWGGVREEVNIFFFKKRTIEDSNSEIHKYKFCSHNKPVSCLDFFFFFPVTTRKFFKVPNLDAQMDYILELGLCQSPVTVTAYLPAVAEGVGRGAHRQHPSAARAPAFPGGALGTTPSRSTGPHSQKALTALGLSLSAASYSPPIPSLGIPLSLPQPLSQRVFLQASPPAEPSLLYYGAPATHTPSPAASRVLTRRLPHPLLSARPLPPSRHPSPGRPRAAPHDGDPGAGWPGPPTAGRSPTRSHAPGSPARRQPAPGRTHLARGTWGPGSLPLPHRRRQRKRGAGPGGGRLAVGGGACPGMARPRGGAGRGAGRGRGGCSSTAGAGIGAQGGSRSRSCG